MWRRNRDLTILIGCNLVIWIAVWILTLIMGKGDGNSDAVINFFVLPSSWGGFVARPATLLLYMFTQVSFLHMAFNMLWLYWFGNIFLMRATGPKLVWLYVLGGFTGGLAYLTAGSLGMSAGAYLCGSSASVLAVMCAAGVCQANTVLRFMLIGNVKVKWITAICVLLTLAGSGQAPAATVAHVGGIAFGLIYGFVVRYRNGELSVNINKEEMMANVRSFVPRKERDRSADKVAEAMRGRFSDHDRLDALLDKIRISGYDSLSDTERRELDVLSRRLGRR